MNAACHRIVAEQLDYFLRPVGEKNADLCVLATQRAIWQKALLYAGFTATVHVEDGRILLHKPGEPENDAVEEFARKVMGCVNPLRPDVDNTRRIATLIELTARSQGGAARVAA